MKISILLLSSLLVAGCASGQSGRGTIVMKVSDNEAHVRLPDSEADVGTPVRLFKRVCLNGKLTHCNNVAVADGVVTEVLNDEFAAVRFPPGTVIARGYLVEPIR